MTEIDFALTQNEPTEQLELVGTVLWNKAKLVKHFSHLSLPERNFVYIDIFESELNNGGLFGFFFNNSGEYAHEVLTAFETVNALESVEIYDCALRIFKDLPVPKDIFLRRLHMNTLSEPDKDKWLKLEEEFINTTEDLVELLLCYIKQNKAFFEY